jgi:NadR type nicotinamide-nucleotide adenylyltransferase
MSASASGRRFAHGLVLGKFYPLHAGHSALIRRALVECDRVTVEVLGSVVESIPLEVRAAWLREEHPTARVAAAWDEAEVDYDSPAVWDEHMQVIEGLLDAPVDAVFTSDPYGAELARRLDAEWVQVDPDRVATPVSGRAIRSDVAGHWHLLPASVRSWFVQRIVLLGAESTGTTTLAEMLAAELGTEWIPEYGREHTITREGGLAAPWRDDEFEIIADRQVEAERAAARIAPRDFVICDTDMLATVLWFERYQGRWPVELHARALAHPPLLYLLTGDEIPFVQDGLRDGEHLRHDMQQRFRDVLSAQTVPWIEVHGTPQERLEQSAAAVLASMTSAHRLADPIELRD